MFENETQQYADDDLAIFIKLLDEFRYLDIGVHTQTIRVFLIVALHSFGWEISMKKLGIISGMSDSSISRNISALSTFKSKNRVGLGLVDVFYDDKDSRKKIVRLTSRGNILVRKLHEIQSLIPVEMPDGSRFYAMK